MSNEFSPALHSVLVAIDGESECGKTTTINGIEAEAIHQASRIPGILSSDPNVSEFPPSFFTPDTISMLQNLQDHMTFRSITTISAGNMYRSATLYKALRDLDGEPVTEFHSDDIEPLREVLALPGIKDVLQTDPNVRDQVSSVAQILGVQALCGTMFCDEVLEAYHADGGGNLVVIDARNPIGTMRRNNILGRGERDVNPVSVLPIYIDTPAEVAAARSSGDYETNLARIRKRRLQDTERPELPVVRPTMFLDSLSDWQQQLFENTESGEAPILPFRLDNGERLSLSHIQNFSGRIALTAQELAHHLFHQTQPEELCWDPSEKLEALAPK